MDSVRNSSAERETATTFRRRVSAKLVVELKFFGVDQRPDEVLHVFTIGPRGIDRLAGGVRSRLGEVG